MKVYIDDQLWESYSEWRTRQNSTSPTLSERVSRVFAGINKHLARLDNGGYKIVTDGSVNKVSNSDVRLADTFVDRNDGNRTKKFNRQDIVAQTFAFQEAVYGLQERRRKEVELRMMFMREGFRNSLGTAEEMCVCDQHKVGKLVLSLEKLGCSQVPLSS